MPANQFFIAYDGNKYQETKKYLNLNDYLKYDTIIEPYGGTYGFSRAIYELDNTKKFIIYDNDERLINLYNSLKSMTSDEFSEYINEYNEIMDDLQWRVSPESRYIDKGKFEQMITKYPKFEDLIFYNIKKGKFSAAIRRTNCGLFHQMMANCTFIHQSINDVNYDDIDLNKTLIYLDPPYIMSCNTQYFDSGVDHTQTIHKLFTTIKKANCMFVHSYHFLLDCVFDGKNNAVKSMSYEKKYTLSKKLITHDVFEKAE